MTLNWKEERWTGGKTGRKTLELGFGWVVTVVHPVGDLVDHDVVAPCIYDEERFKDGLDSFADGFFTSFRVFEVMLEQRLRDGHGPRDIIEWFKNTKCDTPDSCWDPMLREK